MRAFRLIAATLAFLASASIASAGPYLESPLQIGPFFIEEPDPNSPPPPNTTTIFSPTAPNIEVEPGGDSPNAPFAIPVPSLTSTMLENPTRFSEIIEGLFEDYTECEVVTNMTLLNAAIQQVLRNQLWEDYLAAQAAEKQAAFDAALDAKLDALRERARKMAADLARPRTTPPYEFSFFVTPRCTPGSACQVRFIEFPDGSRRIVTIHQYCVIRSDDASFYALFPVNWTPGPVAPIEPILRQHSNQLISDIGTAFVQFYYMLDSPLVPIPVALAATDAAIVDAFQDFEDNCHDAFDLLGY